MTTGCAICGGPRLTMKCFECGQRACADHYDTRHALCVRCAAKQGIEVGAGPHRF